MRIDELRQEMDALMRARGIRRLSETQNPDALHSKLDDFIDDRPYYTGYDYARLYGWDQYFEGILQIYCKWELTYLQNSLKMFLERADKDGFIPRCLPLVWWGMCHAQPFLAQQALLLKKAGDDLQWMWPEYYFNMKKYLLYWERRLDVRGCGLSIWDHAGHSGMDNHYERAGTFHDAFCEGVDLNSYLVREYEAFALIADHLKQSSDAIYFRRLAEKKRAAINRWCWNESDGMYYDYHARENRQIPVKHAGVFATLWASVPSPAQAGRLVKEHLLNPDEFWRNWPLPALAAGEPGYFEGYLPEETIQCCTWRAHSWMPVNYYAFHGLLYYGFKEAAAELAKRNREMFCREPFREYYKADSGTACGRDPFWGWSGLALYMEEELEKNIDPTALIIKQESKNVCNG